MDFELQGNVYRSRLLLTFDWLEHAFGTRSYAPPEPLATLRQIHSDIVHSADRPGCLGEGDALLSDIPGLWIGVKTADCLPILLVDTRHRAVAALHAGWRGTAAGIAAKTAAAMTARWGTRPEDLYAAIGPGIGRCCFEVGPEVAVEFGEPPARTHLDLAEINRRQMAEAGIPEACLSVAGLCTVCHAGAFHSFRRDREAAGRMMSAIRLKA